MNETTTLAIAAAVFGAAMPSPSRSSAAKMALERQLDEATAAHHRQPRDGFADTLPSPQYREYLGLLFT